MDPQRPALAALVRQFQGLRVQPSNQPAQPSDQQVEHALTFWRDAIRRAWPNLKVDFDAFALHLATLLPEDRPLTELVESWHVEDLYLAYACAQGHEPALHAFAELFDSELRAAVARLRADGDLDDVRQLVWQRLFIPTADRPARILDFSGRGELRAWYRVAVVRALLDKKRQLKGERRTNEEHRRLSVEAAPTDPETEYFKHVYRAEFQRAFESAVEQLEPSERNTLRAYYAEQLTVDQLAAAFGIHRATAARRVSRARDRLLELTRAALSRQLALSAPELQSVLRMIKSRLHLSIQRLFASSNSH